MKRFSLHFIFAAVSAVLLSSLPSCSDNRLEPDPSQRSCERDMSCPLGEECAGFGCVPVAATVYPNIQLASPLMRRYLDGDELAWRAAHNDLLIANVAGSVDAIRAVNPNVKLMEYLNIRYHRYDSPITDVAVWAAQHGFDPEDFYLHYREDVEVPAWAGEVLVEGFPAGTIPGWNPDWSPGDPPASASERSMSRVVGLAGSIGNPWYMVNVNYPGFRAFVVDFVASVMDGSKHGLSYAAGPMDGIMADCALYYPEIGEGNLEKSSEYYGVPVDYDHPYPIGLETLYPELMSRVGARLDQVVDLTLNLGHVLYLSRNDRFSQNVQNTTSWLWGEVWVTHRDYSSPTTGSQRCITYDLDYQVGIVAIVQQSRKGGRRLLGARDMTGDGLGTERGKLYTLALYYLTHNANTYYIYQSRYQHTNSPRLSTWQWNPAVEFDIGRPDQIPAGTVDFEGKTASCEHYVLASGPDPAAPALTYRVLARRFTNGLVVAKMLPAGSLADDRSYTTHQLDGSYFLLGADGTLGNVVTQIRLRNNEGAILVPAD